jgi:hypothetical protein
MIFIGVGANLEIVLPAELGGEFAECHFYSVIEMRICCKYSVRCIYLTNILGDLRAYKSEMSG